MSFLGNRQSDGKVPDAVKPSTNRHISPLFPECSNPRCASGRLHLWRNRRTPTVEGGWLCGPACTLRRVRDLIARELEGHVRAAQVHAHRIPLGLILLAQGWISHEQLKKALYAKGQGYPRRIGTWLIEHCAVDEQRVTQALSLQWNCPVFSGEPESALLAFPPIPRIFLDAFGLLPLRLTGSGSLHVAFEDRIDHSLTWAIEKMIGRRVEAGVLSGSEFRRSHQRMLSAPFPRARLVEVANRDALATSLVRVIERMQPIDARIVRVHHLFWLRLWAGPGKRAAAVNSPVDCPFEDVVSSIATFE